jgi:2-keto-4-pentenoate hydratase/2-oxohepta-3-ene-1,7-dioic acid hydratase in catechol pathway
VGLYIINDVTARDLHVRHSQWLIGKSQDTFCPMGPWAVTRDALDLADTQVQCWINGELRQGANTRDLIFDVCSGRVMHIEISGIGVLENEVQEWRA